MRRAIALFSIMLLSAFPVLADLSATTSGYLKEVGLDPSSAGIVSVAGDAIRTKNGEVVSLDELARRKKSKAEIERFVSTRRFVKAYVQDQTTRLPATDDYDAVYLTDEEKAFVQPAFRKAGDELYLRSLQQKGK
jgi:hypothetical protein